MKKVIIEETIHDYENNCDVPVKSMKPTLSSKWEVNMLVDKIWSKMLKGCQDGKITIGDAYRMKSDLFIEVKDLLSSQIKEIEGEVEKYFDQFRSSSQVDKKGKRVFGVGGFEISTKEIHNDILSILKKMKGK